MGELGALGRAGGARAIGPIKPIANTASVPPATTRILVLDMSNLESVNQNDGGSTDARDERTPSIRPRSRPAILRGSVALARERHRRGRSEIPAGETCSRHQSKRETAAIISPSDL